MIKKTLGLLYMVWLTSISGMAQKCEYILKGSIIDSTEKVALPGTLIQIVGQDKQAISNKDGYFAIDSVCAGPIELHISHLNCEHIHIKLLINGDTSIRIFIKHQEQVFSEFKKIVVRKNVGLYYVSNQELERNKGLSISALMTDLGGVTMLQSGSNIGKPMVNGLYGSRVLIINNGIRQEGQNWGAEHAPEIDAFLASDIVLVKGAETLRYGGDGIGGVILVESPSIFSEKSKTIQGMFNTIGLSNGRGGIVSAYLGNKLSNQWPLSWRIQGTGKNVGSYSVPHFNLANTGNREINYSGHVGFQKNSLKSEVFYSHFYNQTGLYPGAMTGNLSDLQQAMQSEKPLYIAAFSRSIARPFQQVNHQLLKFKSSWQIRHNKSLDFTFSHQKNHREEYDILRSANAYKGPSFDYYINTTMGEMVWKRVDFHHYNLQAGLWGIYQSNAYTGKFFIPGFYQKGVAQFIILQHNKNFDLSIRNDFKQYDIYLWNNKDLHINRRQYLGPSYVVEWYKTIGKTFKYSLQHSYTWRAPAPNELYANGLHQALASIEKGDSTLKKEQSLNFSVNTLYQGKRLQAETEIFVKHINGYINLVPDNQLLLTIRGAFPVYRYEQSNARLSGINFRIHWQFYKNWNLKLKSQLMLGSNLTQNQYLNMMPPINGKLSLNYSKGKHKADITGEFNGRQYRYEAGSDFIPPPPGYFILGANWTYQCKIQKQRINFNISVYNLFNTSYRSYLNRLRYFTDEQGRQINLKIIIPINKTIHDEKN